MSYIKFMKKILSKCIAGLLFIGIITISGCSKKTAEQTSSEPEIMQIQPQIIGSQPLNQVLKATIFKMSGDYADNVAVTLGPDGNLIYFPAPGDISVGSKPVAIADGWYLNRQGLAPGSVFTKWTFEQYSQLPSVPSPSEIKKAIIPGARVSEFLTLPISASEAASLTPAQLTDYLPR